MSVTFIISRIIVNCRQQDGVFAAFLKGCHGKCYLIPHVYLRGTTMWSKDSVIIFILEFNVEVVGVTGIF